MRDSSIARGMLVFGAIVASTRLYAVAFQWLLELDVHAATARKAQARAMSPLPLIQAMTAPRT